MIAPVDRSQSKITLTVAAERLRAIVLDSEEGAFIGSEEALIAKLGCARNTVRQVARLLEREGLLKVRRGINGGYFGSRPDAGTIEATVSAYLETLDMDAGDVTILASALWVEAVRKAAGADPAEAQAVADRLRTKVDALPADASFEQVRDLELLAQTEVFHLANSSYIKLIFDINVAFSRRRFPPSRVVDTRSPEHLEFVKKWKEARLLELNAIAIGDRELAVLAARYSRKVWHQRIWQRFSFPAEAEAPVS